MANYLRIGRESTCQHRKEFRVWEVTLDMFERRTSYLSACITCGRFRHYIPNRYAPKNRKVGQNVKIVYPRQYIDNLPARWKK